MFIKALFILSRVFFTGDGVVFCRVLPPPFKNKTNMTKNNTIKNTTKMNSYLLKRKLMGYDIKDKDFLLIDTLLYFYNKKKDKDGTVKALPKTMCKECFYDGDQTNTTHFLKPIIKRLKEKNLLDGQGGDTWVLGEEALKLYKEFYEQPDNKPYSTRKTTYKQNI